MVMGGNISERRRAERYAAQLSVTVEGEQGCFTAETKNISASGVLCYADFFVPPMTKLEMTLQVPLIVNQRKSKRTISCVGVVVRTEPEPRTTDVTVYSLAVFFVDITPAAKETLTRYLEQVCCASRN